MLRYYHLTVVWFCIRFMPVSAESTCMHVARNTVACHTCLNVCKQLSITTISIARHCKGRWRQVRQYRVTQSAPSSQNASYMALPMVVIVDQPRHLEFQCNNMARFLHVCLSHATDTMKRTGIVLAQPGIFHLSARRLEYCTIELKRHSFARGRIFGTALTRLMMMRTAKITFRWWVSGWCQSWLRIRR